MKPKPFSNAKFPAIISPSEKTNVSPGIIIGILRYYSHGLAVFTNFKVLFVAVPLNFRSMFYIKIQSYHDNGLH